MYLHQKLRSFIKENAQEQFSRQKNMNEIILMNGKDYLGQYKSKIIPNVGDYVMLDESANCFLVQSRLLAKNNESVIVLNGKIEKLAP